MKLIDKSALVAEIERLQDVLQDPAMNRESMQDYAHGGSKIIKEILSFINTLEVKEVDLEKEIAKYLGDDWKQDTPIEVQSDMIGYARHFFELGLEIQKGE